MSADELLNIEIPVPPRKEQDQIVRFLDWKVSEINRLINLRKKQIAALEELKKSVISQAVTKGLDPNAKMKDSGVAWIGEIPDGWALVRNKSIFTESKDVVGKDSGKHLLLSLTLNGIIPRDIESGKGKFPIEFDTYKVVKKGDIAFCLFDIDETPRTVGLSKYDGMLTGAYTICHVRNVNPLFAYYFYLALDNSKALRPLYSGLRKTINTNTFLGIKFPLPSSNEQSQIVDYLDMQTAKINEAIDKKKKQIELLQELKIRLISDAVTGKIDVRGVEIPDCEYTEEEVDMDALVASEDINEEAHGDER